MVGLLEDAGTSVLWLTSKGRQVYVDRSFEEALASSGGAILGNPPSDGTFEQSMSKKYIILLAIGLSVIGLDQWSKLMAVQYLRHPGNHCYDKRRACEDRCREGLARNQGSLVSCMKRCNLLEQGCQKEQNLLMSRWNYDLDSMKQSGICRSVSQPWSGSNAECIVVPGFFHFRYQTNPGAAWGLFSDYPPEFRRPFFITITILAILFIIYLFSFRVETEHRQMVWALSLILGGALGNFLDRLRMDYVVDFIYWFVHIGGRSHSWPTFNVADVAISVGVVLIAIEVLRSSFDEEYADRDDYIEPPQPASPPHLQHTPKPEASPITPEVSSITTDTSSITTETSTITTEASSITPEASSITTEASSITTDTSTLTPEASTLETEVSSITSESSTTTNVSEASPIVEQNEQNEAPPLSESAEKSGDSETLK